MREIVYVIYVWIFVEKILFIFFILMKIGYVNVFDFFYFDRKYSVLILFLIKVVKSIFVYFKGL